MSAHVRILKSEQAVAAVVAAKVIDAVGENPSLVLGLPTGRTPVLLYARLVEAYRQGRINFSRVTTFNLDEFLGLPPEHPASYRTFMETHLFKHVNLNRRRIHFLHGAPSDPEVECRRYEQQIARAGGIDLMLLGIGSNGHIGFNEPGRHLSANTHRARLAPGTRRSNAGLFGGKALTVPKEALTMGVGTILRCASIVLVATGEGKADALVKGLEGPVTTRMPASLLQLHAGVEVVVDRAAGARLRRA